MEIGTLSIQGPLLLKPKRWEDERGTFFESYNESVFTSAGLPTHFVQDNQSVSHLNVVRGLHFQHPPYEQGKLVRVVSGAALDVILDIRVGSPTYGQHLKLLLDAASGTMLWIPPGFAHGFLSLEEGTVFLYKCTGAYHQPAEDGIRWNDPELSIDWGISDPIVSSKDSALSNLSGLQSTFRF